MFADPYPLDVSQRDYRRLEELRGILSTGLGLPRYSTPRKFLADLSISERGGLVIHQNDYQTDEHGNYARSSTRQYHRKVIDIVFPENPGQIRTTDFEKLARERDLILRRYVPGWNAPRNLIPKGTKKFTDPILTWDFPDVIGFLSYPQSSLTIHNDYVIGKPIVTDGTGRVYTKRERQIFENAYKKRTQR